MARKTLGRVVALAAVLFAGSLAAPGAGAQSYQYPPQGYSAPDPYSQYYAQYTGGYAQPYGQGYAPYGTGSYGAPGAYSPPAYSGYGSTYGAPAYSGYGSAYGPPAYSGYGSAYGAPAAYSGYSSAPPPYYGAPYQAPGAYGQPPAPGYPQPTYAGANQPPYPGQNYYAPNMMVPPLGLPYAPPPQASSNGFLLTATLTGPNGALLTWNGIPGAVSYAIYQSINNGQLQFASTSTGTSTSVPLTYGGMSFQVRALASGGSELMQSNVATPVPGLGAGTPQNVLTGPGVPSQSQSSVTANVQQGSLFIGTQITVLVMDDGRMPVSGRLVTSISSRPGYDTIMPANGTTPVTDGSGRVFFNVRGSQPGQSSFQAYVDNILVGSTVVNFQ